MSMKIWRKNKKSTKLKWMICHCDVCSVLGFSQVSNQMYQRGECTYS